MKKTPNTRRPWGKGRRRKLQSIEKSFNQCLAYLKDASEKDGGRLVRALGYALLAVGEMATGLPGRPVNLMVPKRFAKLMDELKGKGPIRTDRVKIDAEFVPPKTRPAVKVRRK
jgi:hypothetical protein